MGRPLVKKIVPYNKKKMRTINISVFISDKNPNFTRAFILFFHQRLYKIRCILFNKMSTYLCVFVRSLQMENPKLNLKIIFYSLTNNPVEGNLR